VSISSRFAIAIHILALLEVYRDEHSTSEFIASSVGTNPVVIRRITRMLAKAGLIRVQAGVGGAELTRRPRDITLLEVYQAVAAVGEDGLFSVHDQPNPRCLVGGKIQTTLEGVFTEAQSVMEKTLKNKTMQDIVENLAQKSTPSY
jgi:DNA-binding IscR family transcriptional regulator